MQIVPDEELVAEAIREIKVAFHRVSREGGVSFHEARALDDPDVSEDERVAARAIDIDTRWEEVPVEYISGYSGVTPFLDPIGFRYYIPAYMEYALKTYWTSPANNTDDALFALLYSEPERILACTQDQRLAICHFLLLMAVYGEEHEREIAEESLQYWSTTSS